MFDFLKRKKNSSNSSSESPVNNPENAKESVFLRLKKGLAKTRAGFTNGLANLFLGKKSLDDELLNEIEMRLLSADVGVKTTEQLILTLTQKLARKELNNPQAALDCLQTEMRNILRPCSIPLQIAEDKKPFVILVVGVNGSGKTTTIGKLAHYFQEQKKNIMLAAGDTFRAAAIQQLQVWGERNHVPVVAQQPGADTAAVIFDALEAAKARQADILIADTAGRLHTQSTLMMELKKIKRVLAKIDPTAPHEILIVLDATLGQNTLHQVKQFNEILTISGIVLTKLDGTAKGGVIFPIAQQTKIPIRFIGIGEDITDLRPFDADEFIQALFALD